MSTQDIINCWQSGIEPYAIQRGDTVRSTGNNIMLYRVQQIGPKRAKLMALGIGYFTCYCPVSLLRIVSRATVKAA